MRRVSDTLHHRFDDLVGAALVDQVIEEEVGRFDRARVDTFVPVLVERAARRRLAATAAGARPCGHDRSAGVSAQLSPRASGQGHSSTSAPTADGGDPDGGGESGRLDADDPARGTSRPG